MYREAYLCNLLTEMFRPRFEDPIDSAQDLVDRNIQLFQIGYFYKGMQADMSAVNRPEWTHIAETMVPVKDWDEFAYYVEHNIHGNGTHAVIGGFLKKKDLEIAPAEKWWRSKEKMPGDNAHCGYLTAKHWILNEV